MGSCGLMFGISDDWGDFYSFEVAPNGYWRILKKAADTWQYLGSGSSGHINGGGAANRLKVERYGSRISAYVNGNLLASVSDSAYTGSRYVGLIAQSADQSNVDARFDE